MSTTGHRWFAGVWDWASRHETQREQGYRKAVAGGATGKTLEIGYGVGSNWPFLAEGVSYTGIEPDPYMRARAERHLPAGDDFRAIDGDAHALDFEDASFDTVLGTLVFCTIPDQERALREVRRVLKPGGEFRFWEHIRADGRAGSTAQDVITPVWRRLGGGCRPNRDTLAAIEGAGFAVHELRSVKIGPLPGILGSARPSSASGA